MQGNAFICDVQIMLKSTVVDDESGAHHHHDHDKHRHHHHNVTARLLQVMVGQDSAVTMVANAIDSWLLYQHDNQHNNNHKSGTGGIGIGATSGTTPYIGTAM
jgi:hypothetical protein